MRRREPPAITMMRTVGTADDARPVAADASLRFSPAGFRNAITYGPMSSPVRGRTRTRTSKSSGVSQRT